MNDQEEIPPSRRRGRPPRTTDAPVTLSDLAPPADAPVPAEVSSPSAPVEPQAVLPSVPPSTTPASSGWVPFMPEDVVQINNPGNLNYGLLFTVGDMRELKVHGYYIVGRKVEYITANEDECHRIGVGKVRTRNPCSKKWGNEGK